MRTQRVFWSVGLTAVIAVATSCGGASSSSSSSAGSSVPSVATSESPEGTTVGTTVKDFAISLAAGTAPAGEVTFKVTNDGPTAHEFVVLKTDEAQDGLPVADGKAAEEGDGITHVGEVEDIATGATTSLALQLTPGNYVLVCNLIGHYQSGMHIAFTVS